MRCGRRIEALQRGPIAARAGLQQRLRAGRQGSSRMPAARGLPATSGPASNTEKPHGCQGAARRAKRQFKRTLEPPLASRRAACRLPVDPPRRSAICRARQASRGRDVMALKTLLGSEELARYVNETLVRETDLQRRLRAETARLPSAGMQISADQGAFLAFLVRLIGARRALEVGTFTGYSALCIASALPEGGELVACDVSEEWTGIARRYWQEAGLAARITSAPGAGKGDPGGADRGGARHLRLRLHRRRQGILRRLLRGHARAAPAGRADGARQHAARWRLGRGRARLMARAVRAGQPRRSATTCGSMPARRRSAPA